MPRIKSTPVTAASASMRSTSGSLGGDRFGQLGHFSLKGAERLSTSLHEERSSSPADHTRNAHINYYKHTTVLRAPAFKQLCDFVSSG